MKNLTINKVTPKCKKTDVYLVSSNHSGDILGEIKWYAPWRRYVFHPKEETLYSHDCLEEIAQFIFICMDKRNQP